MKDWIKRQLVNCTTKEEKIATISRLMTISTNKVAEYSDRLTDEIRALREINAGQNLMED